MVTPEEQVLLDEVRRTRGVEASAVKTFGSLAARLRTAADNATSLSGLKAAINTQAQSLEDGATDLAGAIAAIPKADLSVSGPTSVGVGGTIQLSGSPSDGSTPMAWKSDDETVATVDANGIVTGVATGTARIRALTETAEGTLDVTVS